MTFEIIVLVQRTLMQNTYSQLSFASSELNDQQSQLLQEQQVSTLPRNAYIPENETHT